MNIGLNEAYTNGDAYYTATVDDSAQMPANLPPGTPAVFWKPFTQGFNAAMKALRKKSCSSFYGGQGAATMNASTYRFLDLGLTAGASTNPGFSVFVNSNPKGPYMNPPANFLGVRTAPGIRGLILLHELGHELSNITGFVADAGPSRLNINLQQTHEVINVCF
jgi:hypothetical protein